MAIKGIIGGDGVTSLGIDTGNTFDQLDTFASGLANAVDALEALAGATTRYNSEGDLLGHTFKQILADGSTLTTVLDRVKTKTGELTDNFLIASQTVTKAKKAIVDFNAIQANLNEKNLTDKLKSIQDATAKAKSETLDTTKNTAFEGIKSNFKLTDATPGEVNDLNQAIVTVVNNLDKEGVSLSKIDDLFRRLKVGADDFAVSEQKIVAQLQRVNEAGNRLGSAQGKIRERVKADASKNLNTAEVDAARNSTNVIYGQALTTANPAQLLAYNRALNQALLLVQKGTVTSAQFAQTLNSVRAGQISTNLTPALAQLQQRLVALQGAFTTFGTTANKAFSNLGITAGGVIRIFEAQAIYAALGAIQQTFGGATHAAAEYSKQIGLVQTISQDANVSTEEWTDGIRALSDKLNLPIADTAAATYEALSNQVAKGADAFKFLSTAGQFARATNSSLANSVDLISAALNSYNLSAGEAEAVSRSLFTTIDKGRVTASELAASIGRIYTQGANLNVGYQEVNAVLATLTIQGVKSNEAFTLFGSVLQKLNKPTEELTKVLTQLGYATSEDAISGSGGVIPFLIKLRNLSNEGRTAFNQLFDEIKGRRGFENLTSDGGRAVLDNLAAQKSNTDEYNNAKGIVSKTLGQQFESQINKISNFFTVDVGGTFLKNVVALSDSMGGLAKRFIEIVNIIKIAVTVVGIFYTAIRATATIQALREVSHGFSLIRTAIVAATSAGEALVAVELTAAAAISAATAGASVVAGILATYFLYTNDFYDKVTSNLREITEKYKEEAEKITKIEQDAADKRAKIFNESVSALRSATSQYAAVIRSGLTKANEALKASGSSIADRLKAQLDLVSGTARDRIQELEHRLKAFESKRKDNTKALQNAPNDFADTITKRNLAVNDYNVDHGARDRGLSIQFDAVNRLKKAAAKAIQFDLDNPEKLEQLLQKIDSTTEDIFQRALKSGDKSAIAAADGLILHNEQQRITLLNRQNALIREQARLTADAAAKQKAIFEQFQEAQKHVISFSAFEKNGDLKDKYKGAGGTQKAVADLKAAQDKAFGLLGQLNPGIDTQIHTSTEYAKQLAELTKIGDEQRKNTAAQVNEADRLRLAAIYAERQVSAYEQLNQLKTKLEASNQQAIKDQQDQLVEARKLADIIGTVGKDNTLGTLGRLLYGGPLGQGLQGQDNTQVLRRDERYQGIADKADELKSKLNTQDFATSKQAVADAIKLYQDLIARIETADKLDKDAGIKDSAGKTFIGPPKRIGAPDQTFLSGAKEGLESLQAFQKSQGVESASSKGLKQVDAEIKTLATGLQNLDPAFAGLAAKIEAAGNIGAKGLQPIEDNLQSILEKIAEIGQASGALKNLQNAAAPAVPVNTPVPSSVSGTSSDVEEHARGGRVGYYATGGFVSDFLSGKYVKGTDTIPTMLTKGEYVVDAGNTKKFLPLLRSISDGSFKPSPHGVVTSTNVGDIHINVQGGNSSTQTVREIGSGLRRGIRQGTIRLQ